MKTEVKKIDGAKREIIVEVSGDIVKNKFADVFKKIGQEAKVAGFRPGHVPQDILEKNFSAHAHDQVLRELIPEVYNQAIEKEALDVIDLPNISDVKLDRQALSFKAEVEITPEIELKKYKGRKIEFKKIQASPEDVKRQIDALKESRKIDVLDDNFARGLGYAAMADLQKAIEMQVYLTAQNQQRQKIESELIEGIVKELDFKVPQALVNRQLEDLVRQTKLDLAIKGLPREKIEAEEKRISEELTPQAKDQVKTYLVLSAIARKENIAIDDQMPRKVVEFLLKEADWKEIN